MTDLNLYDDPQHRASILADQLVGALVEYEATRDRNLQRHIGPSDLGFCRQKALLKMREVEPTDDVEEPGEFGRWPAFIGTAIHAHLDTALYEKFGTMLTGDQLGRLTATFPNGIEVTGTPDRVFPEANLLVDDKTKNGLALVKRSGASFNDRAQRHTYALACIQAGILDGDKPVYVANVYWDRSGDEKRPHVELEEFDPSFTREIQDWIEDVIYARKHEEDASRDVVAAVCERICEYFTACRGGVLPDTHEPELLTDPEAVSATEAYVRGRDMEKEGKRLKMAASAALVNRNGLVEVDGQPFQVRWVTVGARAAYQVAAAEETIRIDIRKAKAPKQDQEK